jgi:hypothetical protein
VLKLFIERDDVIRAAREQREALKKLRDLVADPKKPAEMPPDKDGDEFGDEADGYRSARKKFTDLAGEDLGARERSRKRLNRSSRSLGLRETAAGASPSRFSWPDLGSPSSGTCCWAARRSARRAVHIRSHRNGWRSECGYRIVE